MADEQNLPDDRPEGTPPPAPAKKAPAKKAPAKKAAAKKAPAKKAPAKKAPAKKAPVPVATGAKEAAAQAKSTVDRADNSASAPSLAAVAPSPPSRLPLVVAIAVSLLAILLVRQLRRGGDGTGSAD